MTSRKKRLAKLIELRAKELDRRVAALAAARGEERAANEHAEQERGQLARAAKQRADAIAGPLDAASLMLTTDYLMTCAKRREIAEQKLLRARRAVIKAQTDVQAAKNDLKKIELLSERVAAEERVTAARLEQRATDELVTLRRGDGNRRRSSEA